jgi:site-specific DNA-cytosine methylase
MTSSSSPIVVDMFCSAGGESCGIRQATTATTLNINMYAINHWEQTLETHQTNFHAAEYICRDIQDINLSDI